jgi:hypothetical protein
VVTCLEVGSLVGDCVDRCDWCASWRQDDVTLACCEDVSAGVSEAAARPRQGAGGGLTLLGARLDVCNAAPPQRVRRRGVDRDEGVPAVLNEEDLAALTERDRAALPWEPTG